MLQSTLALAIVLSVALASASAHGAPRGRERTDIRIVDASAERRAVEAALAIVPSSTCREVVIIDPDLVADPSAIRQVDAFIVREADGSLRPKVYLNRESTILREAARGVDFYVKGLAAVIVHEIAHLNGRTEVVARSIEQRFFQDLIARGLVPQVDGLRYLALMRGRSPDDGVPGR